ncbi:MAG: type I restriction enzyme HsdR N-terminal domain-containing protein [Prevotella sp.]|nr:type I restriction enzyme HsdR N-terminal domain-containing protein [Prevotella sp.]
MYSLNLPKYPIKTTILNGKPLIFDILRRRYVVITPEEWVRQHFINFLIRHKSYPYALLANEVTIHIGEKTLRCDSLLMNKLYKPVLLIEYKAPSISISQKVFDQISAYNMLLHVDYLIVSNGMQHYCCKMDYNNKTYSFLNDIPDYSQIAETNRNV